MAQTGDGLTVRNFHARTLDGVTIEGDFRYSEGAETAVVFLHRWTGARDEWRAMFSKLAESHVSLHVAAMDFRGHGGSTRRANDESALSWTSISDAEIANSVQDVRAAIAYVDSQLHGPLPSIILVGSDLGATIAARVAESEPRVRALALISPGASLHGQELYRAYAPVRERASFIAGAENDTIAEEPLSTLSAMNRAAILKRYPGAQHGAAFIAEAHPEFWADLTDFIVRSSENVAALR